MRGKPGTGSACFSSSGDPGAHGQSQTQGLGSRLRQCQPRILVDIFAPSLVLSHGSGRSSGTVASAAQQETQLESPGKADSSIANSWGHWTLRRPEYILPSKERIGSSQRLPGWPAVESSHGIQAEPSLGLSDLQSQPFLLSRFSVLFSQAPCHAQPHPHCCPQMLLLL